MLGIDFCVSYCPPLPRTYHDANHAPYTDEEIVDMWRAYTEAFANDLRVRGIEFITPPDGITDAGFLRKDLGQTKMVGDHHGNAKYGELFLPKILETLRR